MTIYAFQTQPYFLAGAGAVIGDTTLTLKTMKDIDGNTITMSVFGTIGYFTLEPGNSNLEEQGIFTGLTNNSNGTTTLTGVSSVTFAQPYTTTSGLSKTHAGSSTLVISNTSGFEGQYAAKANDEIITGQWTFNNTPIVPGVVSDASTTVKGVSKVSVAPISPSNPISVGDNDPRVPTQNENDALQGTGTPSNTDRYVNQSTLSGYIPSSGVYQNDIDQSQATTNSTYAVGEANSTTKHAFIGEKFIPTTTGIRGVKLWKVADTGTFTGSVKISLQVDSMGSPSGADLASFTITNTAWLKLNSAAEFAVQFTTPYTSMVIGNSYWIVITPSTTDNSNHPNLGANTAGGYAGGALKFNNGTDGWTLTATTILYFKTTQINTSKIVETLSTTGLPSPMVSGYAFIADDTTQTSVVTTITETTVFSTQLEGGQISINSGLRIRMKFLINGIGDGTSAQGVIMRVKYNGTPLLTYTKIADGSTSGASFVYYYDFDFITINQSSFSSQSYKYTAGLLIGSSSTVTLTPIIASSGTSSVDFSQPGLLEITLQPTKNAAGDNATYYSAIVEKIT